MSAKRVRVLVVDDSAFARKVMREVLRADARLEVVGAAHDGLEALEKVAELSPDVVTLDLVMPHLDGLGVLRALPDRRLPSVVLVSMSDRDSELVVEGLRLGAVDFVHKPTSLATERLYELRHELVGKVLAAAHAHQRPQPQAFAAVPPSPAPGLCEVLVVGTSTGGPQALGALVAALPADFPLAVAIALHIPREYTPALAARLDALGPLRVREAGDGEEVRRGQVVLAPGGRNLGLERRAGALTTRVSAPAPDARYVPSVDVLFESAARACGPGVLAAVLTGMGDDGLRGARAVRAAGGLVLAEAESSCVVYGMPRCVVEAGLAARVAPLERLAESVVAALAGSAQRGEAGPPR